MEGEGHDLPTHSHEWPMTACHVLMIGLSLPHSNSTHPVCDTHTEDTRKGTYNLYLPCMQIWWTCVCVDKGGVHIEACMWSVCHLLVPLALEVGWPHNTTLHRNTAHSTCQLTNRVVSV